MIGDDGDIRSFYISSEFVKTPNDNTRFSFRGGIVPGVEPERVGMADRKSEKRFSVLIK
jgi:hypothetical protein